MAQSPALAADVTAKPAAAVDAQAKAAADAAAKAHDAEKARFLVELPALRDFGEIALDGMAFIKVPAGTFVMGTPPEQIASLKKADLWDPMFSVETPAHVVTITRPFLLGKTEVTQAQWKRIAGIAQFEAKAKSKSKSASDGLKADPSAFKGDDLPVDSVSYTAAQTFIDQFNDAWGGGFRLPSEAEWEYACRAGGTGLYGNGAGGVAITAETLPDYAWYGKNAENKTHPVATRKPNAWGLCDMLGSVWEWCRDAFGPGFYGASPKVDPVDTLSVATERVFRGGSWFLDGSDLRAAFRGGQLPGFRSAYVGFRLARSL